MFQSLKRIWQSGERWAGYRQWFSVNWMKFIKRWGACSQKKKGRERGRQLRLACGAAGGVGPMRGGCRWVPRRPTRRTEAHGSPTRGTPVLAGRRRGVGPTPAHGLVGPTPRATLDTARVHSHWQVGPLHQSVCFLDCDFRGVIEVGDVA